MGRMLIPKIIYRTWLNSTLPEPFNTAWQFTQTHNPTFAQMLFTDQDMDLFMEKHHQLHPVFGESAYKAFYAINPVYGTARADLFRYLLLYEYGGIYLDAKSAARNISKVIHQKDEFVTSHWPLHSIVRFWSFLHLQRFHGEYQQWWLASTAQHPTMKAIINKIVSNIEMHTEHSYMLPCDTARSWVGDSPKSKG